MEWIHAPCCSCAYILHLHTINSSAPTVDPSMRRPPPRLASPCRAELSSRFQACGLRDIATSKLYEHTYLVPGQERSQPPIPSHSSPAQPSPSQCTPLQPYNLPPNRTPPPHPSRRKISRSPSPTSTGRKGGIECGLRGRGYHWGRIIYYPVVHTQDKAWWRGGTRGICTGGELGGPWMRWGLKE